MEQSRTCIGIDLGTAYTRVAVFDGNIWQMIQDQFGEFAMPSCVAFTDSGVLIGGAAKIQAQQNPTNTIFEVIRLIGRRYSDPSVHNDMRLWPFKVIAGPDDMLQVEVHCKGKLCQFTAVEICSMILTQIKENAQAVIGGSIRGAAVTVPALFNYQQRQAIKEAGMIAGLQIMQIISSPAATALFYGMERLSKSSSMFTNIKRSVFGSGHNMIIFDLGAGTLDVAVVTIKANVCKVRAIAGDVHLGGSDFDNNMVDYFVNYLKQRGMEDISSFPMAISNLKTSCEKAKISLSSYGNNMVPLEVTPLYTDVHITVAKFMELNNELFLKCMRILEMCLTDAVMSIDTVHEVILAGSSTRIPLIYYNLENYFHGKALTFSQNLEVATAYGAACQAFFLSRRENGRGRLSLLDVTPFSLGMRWSQGTTIVHVPRNTNTPFKKESTFRSSKIPCFVEVYEGEGSFWEKNLFCKFELSGTFVPRNVHNIEVCFQIHENGTLEVVVDDIYSGARKTFPLTNRNVEDSQKRVREALHYNERENSIIMASTSTILTRGGTSSNWERIRGREKVDKILSMDKERSEKIMEQPSRQYVEPDEYIIGIDFGTTYSSVAVWQRNGVKIIENEYDSRYTSSVVAFTDTGRLIGDMVHKEQVMTKPTNVIPNIKSLIGKCCSDQSVDHDDTELLPFRVICGNKNRYMVSVHHKNEEKLFAPEEIAAMILSKLKETAEVHLNSKVSKAVISVPSSFNSSQRKAIKDAGAIAGLDVLQLLNETTAAAICYFIQKFDVQSTSEKTLLVFDLGGGNLDVSIVKIIVGTIQVQAVAWDNNLGGEDFDNNMVSYFVGKFMKESNKDISNKPKSLRRLRVACEKAKRVLSTNSQTVVEVDALDEGIDFRKVITRKEFDELNDVLFNKSIKCVERCLEDARLEKSSIDEVVLVGGSTRIPKIQHLLQEFFQGKELCKSINADEAVVHGTAVQAAILSGNKGRKKFNMLDVQDVTSSSFAMEDKDAMEDMDGVKMNVLFPKHTPIPAEKEHIYSTYSVNLKSFSIEVQDCELASTTVFNVSGITPTPRGESIINLSFKVDSSGILNLTVNDASGREENKVVVSKENGGLTEEDIEKMKEAAASYKAKDEDHKARAFALNSLENLAYRIKELAEGSNVSASDKINMKKAADNALAWLDTDPLDTDSNATADVINDRISNLKSLQSKVMAAGS